jgi:GH35 family endo-1,4-beta-xylanase
MAQKLTGYLLALALLLVSGTSAASASVANARTTHSGVHHRSSLARCVRSARHGGGRNQPSTCLGSGRRPNTRHKVAHARLSTRRAATGALATVTKAIATTMPSGYHVGVYANLRGLTGPALQKTAATLTQAGVQFTREIFSWTQLEPQPGVFRWTSSDAFMSQAAAAGLHVMATPAGIPTWISPNYSLGVTGAQQISEYAQFVRQVVARYGSNGTFWLANPGLPRVPIEMYDIWNEPYTPSFWGPSPDPATYAQMFKAAVLAGRTADPQAKFLLEANPGSFAPGSPPFLSAMFQAVPDLGQYADAVSIHPYASNGWSPSYCTPYTVSRGVSQDWRATQYETCRVQDVRTILNANNASAAKIWITEIGYSTSPSDSGAVSDATQASYVHQFFSLLRGPWRGLVDGFQWYQYQGPSSGSDYGLVDRNGTPKPAWNALVSEVQEGF